MIKKKLIVLFISKTDKKVNFIFIIICIKIIIIQKKTFFLKMTNICLLLDLN